MSRIHVRVTDLEEGPAKTVSLAAVGQGLIDLCELVKARLSTLVLVTVAVGFMLGSGAAFQWGLFATTLLGALLGAFGANALNQCWEQRWDGRMARTHDRPLPSGRMRQEVALLVAVGCLVAGAGLLAWQCGPIAAVLVLAIALGYVLVYTPMKRVTAWSLVPGAVVGAAPPLIGWVSAQGELSGGAWTLFAIVFVWQVPHFLAIDWMHREDYARAGYRMVSRADPEGRLTGRLAVGGSVVLIAASLSPLAAGLGGAVYAALAVVLGAGMLAFSVWLALDPTTRRAYRLFLVSLAYLPLLLAALVLVPA